MILFQYYFDKKGLKWNIKEISKCEDIWTFPWWSSACSTGRWGRHRPEVPHIAAWPSLPSLQLLQHQPGPDRPGQGQGLQHLQHPRQLDWQIRWQPAKQTLLDKQWQLCLFKNVYCASFPWSPIIVTCSDLRRQGSWLEIKITMFGKMRGCLSSHLQGKCSCR